MDTENSHSLLDKVKKKFLNNYLIVIFVLLGTAVFFVSKCLNSVTSMRNDFFSLINPETTAKQIDLNSIVFKRITAGRWNIHVEVPESWEERWLPENSDGHVYYHQTEPIQVSLSGIRYSYFGEVGEDPKDDIFSYTNEWVEDFKKDHQSEGHILVSVQSFLKDVIADNSKRSKITVHKIPAIRAIYKSTEPEDTYIQSEETQMQSYFIEATDGYFTFDLSITCPSSKYDYYEPLIERIASSFEIYESSLEDN